MIIRFNYKKLFVFFLPVITILSQWISFAGVNLSWCISIILLMLIFLQCKSIMNNRICLLLTVVTFATPIVNFVFSKSKVFNINLYVSIITGLTLAIYIVQLKTTLFQVFLKGIIFSCIIFSLWGVYEIFTGDYLLFNNIAFISQINAFGQHYPGVAFSNTNDLAQYLVMLYTLTSGILYKNYKVIYVFTWLSIIFVVFHTYSKMSMISIVLFFLFSFIFKMFIDNNVKGIVRLLATVLVLIICFVVFDNKTGIVTQIIERFLIVDSNADYVTGRTDIYMELLKKGAILPMGGFGTAYVVNNTPPHNLFLFILCDYGWGPAILFVSLLILSFGIFWNAAKLEKKDDRTVTLCASIAIFPIMSCVSSCNEQRKVIWMFLGIMIKEYMEYRIKISESRNKI